MSVTGIALVLFLTFHASMNVVALFSEEGYNMICEMLGANWYAVAATAGLAGLVVLHFVYAFWLTVQNMKARGSNKYAVTDKPAKVEWASQNMLVLGIIVILGMGLHLYNFWWHMMAAELIDGEAAVNAANGAYWIKVTFGCPVYTAIYLVWLAALWLHLTHGIWSALQTLGVSGKIWFRRWRCIGNAFSTIIVLMFAAVAVIFCLKANCKCCGDNAQGACTAAAVLVEEESSATQQTCAACRKKCDGCTKDCASCKETCKGCDNDCEACECECVCAEETLVHNHRTKDIREDCPACQAALKK